MYHKSNDPLSVNPSTLAAGGTFADDKTQILIIINVFLLYRLSFSFKETKCSSESVDSEMERISESITANCKNKIFESRKFLKKLNSNFSCEALDVDNCESNHKRWITNAVNVWT